MWDLVPWPEIEPVPPALGAWSLSHWTTRKVPRNPLDQSKPHKCITFQHVSCLKVKIFSFKKNWPRQQSVAWNHSASVSVHKDRIKWRKASTWSLSQKPRQDICWEYRGQPASQPITCIVTHQTTISTSSTTSVQRLSSASCLFWKLQSPPSDLENTRNTSRRVFTFPFLNCLPLRNPSKARLNDAAADHQYPSRAPLPLPELMWSI